MKTFVYVAVFLFIFIESAMAGHFPYYALTLSFLGYMAYSKDIYSVFYAIPIVLIQCISSNEIEQILIFFIIYVTILSQIYRHIMFDKVNILIVTILQAAMYLTFLYFFRIKDVTYDIAVKECIFILLYNFIFYYFEKMKKSRDRD